MGGVGGRLSASTCPHPRGRTPPTRTQATSRPRPPAPPPQVKFFRGNFQDPTFYYNVPLQVATEREITRYYWQQARARVWGGAVVLWLYACVCVLGGGGASGHRA